MAVDYKKKYREFYLPGTEPQIVEVPEMRAVAVRGEGDPNEENGAYQRAIGLLYAISYAVKRGPKNGMEIPGYFDYVVPPLEGFWRAPEETAGEGIRKEEFQWISLIRLPEFVDERVFAQAAEQVERKKKLDISRAEFLTVREGLCVQCLHMGSFDREGETVEKMDRYLEEQGYVNDFDGGRMHHEIYLSRIRRVPPERWKTVIRHPVKRG